uniref:Ovule protein n=1 Tax=Heterorhabditis bacteriophora TaxID=37862 RepID=A0A1I7X9R9_HETBA
MSTQGKRNNAMLNYNNDARAKLQWKLKTITYESSSNLTNNKNDAHAGIGHLKSQRIMKMRVTKQ